MEKIIGVLVLVVIASLTSTIISLIFDLLGD